MPTPFSVDRRVWLQKAVLGGALALGSALPQAFGHSTCGQGRLVLVFLRGAYDGLSAFIPYNDSHYYRLRPTIAIAAPGSGEGAALPLDATFGLHPALADWLPLWQKGILAFVPAAGSPAETRSHFEAQNHWEIGAIDKNVAPAGWMNVLAQTLAGTGQRTSAIGVGEANPQILSGPTPVQRVPKGIAATRTGALASDHLRGKLQQLYVGQDELAQAFQQGVENRMETANRLVSARMSDEMMAADNGAGNAQTLTVDAGHLATLMQQNRQLRLGFLSAGGWDTHNNQGGAKGPLANNLTQLAAAIVRLRKEFSEPGDTIVLVSEFGRTTAENGTRGTDHGHGNAMVLIGDRVNGGRWHGQWRGLSEAQLHQGRDLPVLHDFRDILGQVIAAQFALSPDQLALLFSSDRPSTSLLGLMKG